MRLTFLALAALAVCACSDSTGPLRKTDVSLEFCAAALPDWLAMRNEGEEWQAITPTSGTFTFNATDRVSVAFVYADPNDISTEIFNVTADELRASTRFSCDLPSGTKSMGGSVVGLTGEQVARISMGGSVAQATASQTFYTLPAVATGIHDLVALRFASASSSPPDRIILRRDQDNPAGVQTIPTLDFSTEGQNLASATLTLSNLGSNLANVVTEFMSANGTSQQLGNLTLTGGSNAVSFVTVPVGLQVASDLHKLYIAASGSAGVRTVTQFYQAPANKSITLGPQVNTPTTNTIATSPYLRLHASVASQTEYPDALEIDFTQFVNQVFRAVYIVTTKGFLGGTPATWEATVPDFTGTGYEATWGLLSGSGYDWIAHGFSGGAGDLLPSPPVNGQTLTSATRSARVP